MNRSSHHPTHSSQPTILVVDDEPSVRALLVRWLSSGGYACLQAGSVAEAEQLLAHRSVDLVTSDIMMPGESGAAWVPRLCKKHPELAVLLLTGCDETRLAIDTLTQGAWGYLIKPVSKPRLLAEVGDALARRETLLEQRDYMSNLETTVIEQMRLLRASCEEMTERLVATSLLHHDETGEHIQRIGLMSGTVAETLGWSVHDVNQIRLAAPMHDIGKVGIPDAILRKPGRLTLDEFEIMKSHTTLGAKILDSSQPLPMLKMAHEIALAHHERWDGRGYPHGRRQDEIPASARVVAVVDVYDAITNDRVYRRAMSEAQALEIIHDGIGSHFDPDIATAFLDVLPRIRQELKEASQQRSTIPPQTPPARSERTWLLDDQAGGNSTLPPSLQQTCG